MDTWTISGPTVVVDEGVYVCPKCGLRVPFCERETGWFQGVCYDCFTVKSAPLLTPPSLGEEVLAYYQSIVEGAQARIEARLAHSDQEEILVDEAA